MRLKHEDLMEFYEIRGTEACDLLPIFPKSQFLVRAANCITAASTVRSKTGLPIKFL